MYYFVMNLENTIKTKYKSIDAFAALVGLSPDAVRKYIRGERKPNPTSMDRIVSATNGFITPNLIYGITKKPKKTKVTN